MKTRPAGMDYGTYKAMCAAKKTAPMGEDEFKALPVDGEDDPQDGNGNGEGEEVEPDGDEGAGAGGDDDDDDAEKGLGLGDLRKSLAAYKGVEGAAVVAVGGSRETYLKARLDAGTISKSERAELGRIWAGTAENPNVDGAGRPLRKALVEYLDPEDQEVVNAAPLLKGLLGGVQDRMDALVTRTEAGNEATRQLLVAQGGLVKSLCGAVLELGGMLDRRDKVIKSLEERLGIVEKQPVQPRGVRAAGAKGAVQRPIAKSTTGGGTAPEVPGTGLKKSQVVRGFHVLVKAAGESNDFGTAQRLTEECAAFERSGHLNPGTRAAITAVAAS